MLFVSFWDGEHTFQIWEKQKAIKVASYLKQVGSPTELIIGATGLSKEEVEKL